MTTLCHADAVFSEIFPFSLDLLGQKAILLGLRGGLFGPSPLNGFDFRSFRGVEGQEFRFTTRRFKEMWTAVSLLENPALVSAGEHSMK